MLVIKGATVIDPGNLNGSFDLYIQDGKFIKISPAGLPEEAAGQFVSALPPGDASPEIIEVDARGKLAVPGLIDMHVHLREPGQEYKETIQSGCMAAVAGGFTAVCAMPNTQPVNDDSAITTYIKKRADEAGLARAYPVGAISKGLRGEALCEYGDMKNAGIVAVTDDGRPVMDSGLMRKAMEYARGFGLTVISHSEDFGLSEKGSMNEGLLSTQMGLRGIPNAAESIMVMRDIALSELTGASLHIAHVSTRESVTAIRAAKKRGSPVTAETAPHYFSLTEEAVRTYNTNAKMNPPLRSEEDRQAILEGLADGTIDAIATDHAPHSALEKELEFDRAANGVIGLETALPLSLDLVQQGILTLEALIEKMSKSPAKILGLPNGIREGNPADVTLIDPEITYRIDANTFRSKSRNTPFHGKTVTGRPLMTIVGGKIVFREKSYRE